MQGVSNTLTMYMYISTGHRNRTYCKTMTFYQFLSFLYSTWKICFRTIGAISSISTKNGRMVEGSDSQLDQKCWDLRPVILSLSNFNGMILVSWSEHFDLRTRVAADKKARTARPNVFLFEISNSNFSTHHLKAAKTGNNSYV